MKQLFVLSLSIMLLACGQKGNKPADQSLLDKAAADTANYTTIEWLDSVANFGSVDAGKKVEVKFRFKNTGTKPLILTEVHAGCGCTTPEWTKEPVAPGKEGYVTGIFNSANQHGEVHKMISVRSNTKNGVEHKLTFTGLVNEQLPEPIKSN